MRRAGVTGTARALLGAAGVGLGLWGLWLLLDSLSRPALLRLPLWLGGAVLVDDFVLIPITVAIGWALTRWSLGRRSGSSRLLGGRSVGGRHHRTVSVVRTTLLYVGLTTVVALPLLLRQGDGANSTVLPRDYWRDWLLLEACIVLAGAGWLLIRTARPGVAGSGVAGSDESSAANES